MRFVISAPSQAWPGQPGAGPGAGSPGQVPTIAWCVAAGHDGHDADPGRCWVAVRTRDGLAPRAAQRTVGADRLRHREGALSGAEGQGPRAPTGVEARGPAPRQSRERGRSQGRLHAGGRAVPPAHRQAARWSLGRRRPPDERGRGVMPAEPRGAHGRADAMATPATRRGGTTAPTGVAAIARRGRREPGAPLTARMPHVTGEHRRAGVAAREGPTARGVAGVTQAMDGEPVEANRPRRDQHRRPMAERPRPGRRVDSPKAEGTTRPRRSRGPAEKRVQALPRRLRAALDAAGCWATASGVRPGRRCQDALRRRNPEGRRAPVPWMAELAWAPG
jgi:hypothetical protein